jgi:hypothetical protein
LAPTGADNLLNSRLEKKKRSCVRIVLNPTKGLSRLQRKTWIGTEADSDWWYNTGLDQLPLACGRANCGGTIAVAPFTNPSKHLANQ